MSSIIDVTFCRQMGSAAVGYGRRSRGGAAVRAGAAVSPPRIMPEGLARLTGGQITGLATTDATMTRPCTRLPARCGSGRRCPCCGKEGGMLDHLSIQCVDVHASAAFYDAVLAPLGGNRVMDFGEVIGFGAAGKPEFWIGPQTSGEGFRESHIAFTAPDRAAVRAFFQAAARVGTEVLHEPRLWPEYHASYYGAFVRDPDGNNVEAVCHASE